MRPVSGLVVLSGLAACASAFHAPPCPGLGVVARPSCRPLPLRMAGAEAAGGGEDMWDRGFAVVPTKPVEGKWRNVRNVPGVLRHLLNPDSPHFRPELKAAWDQADKQQRDAILHRLAVFQPSPAHAPAPAAAAAPAASAAPQPAPAADDKGFEIGNIVANAMEKLSSLSRQRSDKLSEDVAAADGTSRGKSDSDLSDFRESALAKLRKQLLGGG